MTSPTATAIAINARNLPVDRAAALRDFVLVSLVLVLVLITIGGAG
jgi:hypothetical protein